MKQGLFSVTALSPSRKPRRVYASLWFQSLLALLLLGSMLYGLDWCLSQTSRELKGLFNPLTAVDSQTHHRKSAYVLLAGAGDKTPFNDVHAASSGRGADPPIPAAAGRLDPFSPLAEDPERNGSVQKIKPVDPLADVAYTGVLSGHRRGDVLGMLHVRDPLLGETTVIRKAGDSFKLSNGQSVKILSLNAGGVDLLMKGTRRHKALQPILEAVAKPAGQATTGPSVPDGQTVPQAAANETNSTGESLPADPNANATTAPATP